jgi:hypothetical protein
MPERKDPPPENVTQFEYRTREPAPKRLQTTFGVAPAVTQPFDAFASPPDVPAVQDFAKSTQKWVPAIQPQQVVGIGRQNVVPPAATPEQPAPIVTRTVIAAGYRAVQAPAAPVPAYPSQPSAAPAREPARSEERMRPLALPEDAREVVTAPAPLMPSPELEPPRTRLRTQVREQQAMTTMVDIKELVQNHSVHMPEVRSEDSSSQWATAVAEARERVPEPAARPQPRRDPHYTDDELGSNPPGKHAKLPRLLAALGLGLALLAASFFFKRAPDAEVTAAPEAQVGAGIPPPQPNDPPAQEHAPAVEQAPPRGHEEPPPRDQAPAPQVAGSVTATSAAMLYIHGQYKEALAEYRLLSRAYPREAVYGELARILRRKLIETCLRTQPHRQEQCKEI